MYSTFYSSLLEKAPSGNQTSDLWNTRCELYPSTTTAAPIKIDFIVVQNFISFSRKLKPRLFQTRLKRPLT